ncbi:hypothetical protein [Pleurocapsa sp. PCC 7319]|uniref:hypothetical protein n=1 Tax=Pleurocapsa sp. PCC 7319 TaxID=118161 RepID=UPI000346E68F|nr:hypothetical protein [Pleurocapsa sp. PCC 7319]
MKINIDYIYSFNNASVTLRVIDFLRRRQLPLNSVTVLNTIDRWIVKFHFKHSLPSQLREDIRAFFCEMGIPYQPSKLIATALERLEAGESPTKIMNRYQVVVVAYGLPAKEEIEIFREAIVARLGYCPQNMA